MSFPRFFLKYSFPKLMIIHSVLSISVFPISIQNLSFQFDKRYFLCIPSILKGTGKITQELAECSVGKVLFTVQVRSTVL